MEGGNPEQVIPFEPEKTGTLVEFSGDGHSLLWSRGSGPDSPWGPGYEMTDLDRRIKTRVALKPGPPRPRVISHDGSSLLALGVEREYVVIAQPLDGGPASSLLISPCPLEPATPADDGRVFVLATRCSTSGADSSRAPGPREGVFLVDPEEESQEDLSQYFAELLGRSYLMSIHPDGRTVFSESPLPEREEGSRDDVLSMTDLETGVQRPLTVSPYSIWTLGTTLGHTGFHTNGLEAHIFDDRFIYHTIQNGGLHLMSVRPGEESELFWTLPDEIVTRHEKPESFQAPFMGDPVGIQGNLVAWVRTNFEGEVTADTRSTLMISDATTGEDHEVATIPGYLYNPYWSRTGQKIALQYRPIEGEESTFAVFDLDERHRGKGKHLTLNTGMTDHATLVGWSAGDEAVIFLGRGIEALEDRGILSMRLDPEAVPVNLTAGESDPDFGVLTSDGTTLVFSATRIVGNTLVRYDVRPPDENPNR